MDMKVEMLPTNRIAFIRQTGPYGPGNATAMESIKRWAKENDLLDNEAIILGIACNNPATTPPESCRYDACIVVENDAPLPEGNVNTGIIEGGKYVVFEMDHTTKALQYAWSHIFNELMNQGCTLDASRPILERYITKLVYRHRCEICLPIL